MKTILLAITLFVFGLGNAQKLNNIQIGEVLTYRIHYGVLTAGSATLSTASKNYNGTPHLYVEREKPQVPFVHFSKLMMFTRVTSTQLPLYQVITYEM